MLINKETALYISAAYTPGNFGATIYNSLFELYKINAVYLPRKITDEKFLIDAIRKLDIRGCSVTMPLKSRVAGLMDELDDIASRTGSVNTIVNSNGRLKGHNTDYYGALAVLSDINPRKALIYGAGSVANSVIAALQDIGCKNISILARRPGQAKEMAEKYGTNSIENIESVTGRFDVFINAAPTSDAAGHEVFSLFSCVDTVFDLVVKPSDTELIKMAKGGGKKTVSGMEMSKWQLQKQFEFYTGVKPDIKEIESIIEISFLTKND